MSIWDVNVEKRGRFEYYSSLRLTWAALRPQGDRGHTWDSRTARGDYGTLEFTPVSTRYSHQIGPCPALCHSGDIRASVLLDSER